MEKKAVVKNYIFLGIMLGAMIIGALVGWLAPSVAPVVKPLGTVFINMMFCVVVPLVFASVAGSVASMGNMRRAGRIMGITVTVFVATGTIAAIIMFALMKAVPPGAGAVAGDPGREMGEYASLPDLLVNFFTVGDFAGLLSRKAMLPLIVFSVLFGFAANMAGGPETAVAKWLRSMTETMLQFVKLVTYYAPVAFFAIFANLVADYGPQIAGAYGRALAVYYPLCLVYVFTAFPLFARFGGGRRGPGVHAAAHHQACCGVPGHLLVGGHYPYQYGGSRADRHQPGCLGNGDSFRGHHAHGRLVLQLCAEGGLCMGGIRPGNELG